MSEMVRTITVDDVDASIQRVIRHAESIWDEWAWQVQNQTWIIKGYADWDEMRRVEYTSLAGVQAPRAERPELIARFRSAGLTQAQTAGTLGISRDTVIRHDEPTYQPRNVANATFAAEDVVEAEIVEDPEPVQSREKKPSAEASVINDIRLYLRTLARSPKIVRLSPVGKQYIIDALRDTITELERN